jgi:hypothetical protein
MQTDLHILRALREHAPAPLTGLELAETSGVPPECLEMRMRSLLSLRYVELVAGGYALAQAATSDRTKDQRTTEVLGRMAGDMLAAGPPEQGVGSATDRLAARHDPGLARVAPAGARTDRPGTAPPREKRSPARRVVGGPDGAGRSCSPTPTAIGVRPC